MILEIWDNKAKTLIDALKLPSDNEVKDLNKLSNNETTHCLLMDDALLWGIDLQRKRLLHPKMRDEHTFTQIEVEVIPRIVTITNSSLFGVPVF
jgi:hypothetical protein